MSRIVVLGGTGYTGTAIVTEAAKRGHDVTSYSRTAPAAPVDGVAYETGSLQDSGVREAAFANADVVVATLSPRGELETGLRELYAEFAELAASTGTRLGVVGGYSSLRMEAGGERIAYGSTVAPEYAAEARTLAEVVDDLVDSAPEHLDWFFVSPAALFGSYAPGEATGSYRTGGDVAIVDENGHSAISGADFATAFVDEIEQPKHSRTQFGVVS